FYPERRYRDVLEQAETDGLPQDQLDAFSAWLKHGRIDAKRDDALAMLHHMRDTLDSDLPPKSVDYAFAHTSLWEAAIAATDLAGRHHDGGADPAIDHGLMDKLRLDDRYEMLLRAGLLRLLAREKAERQGLVVTEEEHRAAANTFRLERRLTRGADLRTWLAARGLDRPDLDRLIHDGLLLNKVLEHLGASAPHLALDELRLGNDYEHLRERARSKRESSTQKNNLELTDIHRALTCYFQERCLAMPDDLDGYARQRGFEDAADFQRALLRDDHDRQISNETEFNDG
ncbi:MAG: hypothetical protein ACR2RE_21235, partial [Geminicoccaceae bacterium]